MFFLNEHLMAAFLSILAFIISFVGSIYYKVGIFSALMRSTVIAFIFMFAGLMFGKVMKNLVVEAFLSAEKKEAKEAEEGEDDEEGSEEEDDTERDIV